MGKILDLNVFVQETLDLRLPGEDDLLNLAKPTQEIVIAMSHLKSVNKKVYDEKSAKTVETLLLLILNSNVNKRVFAVDYVEEVLNMPMRLAIIETYAAWVAGIETDPN